MLKNPCSRLTTSSFKRHFLLRSAIFMPQIRFTAPATFIRFCMVGSIGFAVDAGVLSALVHWGDVNPYAARLCSMALAMTTTWWLNRHFTFRVPQPPRLWEWLRFCAVNAFGAVLNYSVYALVLMTWPGILPAVAAFAGSLAGVVSNYSGARWLVFRPRS